MRELSGVAEAELKKMPITFDIATDPILGPGYQKGRTSLLRELLFEKFGPLPRLVQERVDACSPKQIDVLALKLLKCSSLDELFRRRKPKSLRGR
jgi:hypothetical protein